MNFNSIKWRLQIWYGLILVAVLAGLGIAAFQLERNKMYRQIDAELMRRIGMLADTLNGPPPQDGDNFDPSADAPEPPERRRPPMRENFHLRPRGEALFGGSETDAFYFIITGGDGQTIARSANATGTTLPLDGAPRTRDGKREIQIVTPTRERILVGRSMMAELAELRLTALKLAAVAGVVLFFGLAGGWMLVARTLRPIADISAAAEKISTGDLSQRINVAETKSELGRLALVLNATFARLETAFTLQKRFAADAAHELRTPVSVLIAQTHAALLRRRSYEENHQTIEACHRASQRMRRLITSLLQLARLDAGQEVAKRSAFDFSPVVSECVEFAKSLAEEDGVKMIVETMPVKVVGDAEQLSQVITNLVTNAIQYNNPGGEVRIKIRVEKAIALIQVADTGIGISKEDLPHIFERFYRADKSRSSGNAGLGLAITQAIVEAHGGTIEVSSQENIGTTFAVRLPLA